MNQEPEVTRDLAAQHGLSSEEYDRAVTVLGRTPSYTELGIILKPEDLGSLALYGMYSGMIDSARGWGLEPGQRGSPRSGQLDVFRQDDR